VGTGRGAMAGVLIKNAEALEVLEKVDTLVVDKTGTLTDGKPRVVSVEGGDNVLRLAASLERGSEHPLAGAIVSAAKEKGLELGQVKEFSSITGKGITGQVDGRSLALGNGQLMKDIGQPAEGEGVFLAVDGRIAGRLLISDPLKSSTPEAVQMLRDEGMQIVMVTGDNRTAANAVAEKLGISQVYAEVLPQEKGEVVKELQARGRTVAMAG